MSRVVLLLLFSSLAHSGAPLSFEVNRGQAPADARFLIRKGARTVAVGPAEILAGGIRLQLLGANRRAEAEPLDPQPGVSHYLLGRDPSRWITNVPHYGRVRFRNIYPGIDIIYYLRGQDLEYDFVVAPGADPKRIRMSFRGADAVELDAAGALVARQGSSVLRLHRPVTIQDGRAVTSEYTVASAISVRLGTYDPSRTLTIDPVLSFSTFLGSGNTDSGNAIAIDAAGNTYVAGSTRSPNFPTRTPLQGTLGAAGFDDVFITKLNPAGTALVYSTFLGGSGDDQASGLAVDASGNVYVTGSTTSTNFPGTAGSSQPTTAGGGDAFVAKLNAAGSALMYATYLGGGGRDQANSLAVDSSGNAYVTGFTFSANFPVTAGALKTTLGGNRDAFVTKINTTGSARTYSTYLGGAAGEDFGNSIAVDSGGNAYVAGYTLSADFPATAGSLKTTLGGVSDAFVAKLNAAGSALVYATLVGGSGQEQAIGMAVDSSGNAFLAGWTDSPNFPTVSAYQGASNGIRDAFVAKLNAAGSALLYSTYVGGEGQDLGLAIAIDGAGNAYVAGSTDSTRFPTLAPFQVALSGNVDAFITKLNPAGNGLVYSTYMGGIDYDQASAIAVDANNNAYVTGSTDSIELPVVPGAFQMALGGGDSDAWVAKLIEVQPAINTGGVVNGASFAGGGSVAPGSIASVFGVGLGTTLELARSLPLPTQLGGAQMRFNSNVSAPAFFASAGQVNIQVPWELAGQTQATLTDTVGSLTSPSVTVRLAQFAPGIFTTNSAGTGQGAVLLANTATFAAPSGSIPGALAQPAARGQTVSIYCTGLGPVSNQPASGAAAPGGANLARTPTNPTVTIGGVNATVSFSGLAPGFVGLYQVNVAVPQSVTPGASAPLILTIGGVQSNTVNIAVQ